MKPVAKRCANFALFGMIAVLLGTFAPEVRCISPGDQVTDPDNWIVLTSCDELPDEITEMEANVEVTRKIICEDPTVSHLNASHLPELTAADDRATFAPAHLGANLFPTTEGFMNVNMFAYSCAFSKNSMCE